MSFEIQYDISSVTVSTADEVEAFFHDAEGRYNNWGTRGMVFWIGPADADPDDFPLRIDFDPDAGAAAITWVPGDLVGVADGFRGSQGIRVLEDSSEPLVDIPAERVHADLVTARRAAAAYVSTGRRPENVEWQHIDGPV